MKTLSIKELHAHTGKWARAASGQNITITDRGKPIAELRPLSNQQSLRFPKRDISELPQSKSLDSTLLIRKEREDR